MIGIFYQGLGGLFSGFGSGGGGLFGGGIVTLFVIMLLGIIVMGSIAGFFFFIVRNKKKWFIKVVFQIPRSDMKLVNAEIGKGTYDANRGVVFVKRHKKKPVAMKPFDVKKYLQGESMLTVVQVGLEDYRPVLQESYLEMVDDATGEEAALINAKIDTTESKAWKQSFEREAKNAYSIQTLLQQYAQYIGFGILFFMIFIGFAVLYGRIK